MEELIKDIIQKLKNGKVDKRVKEYAVHNKYSILKDSITVTVRMKEGLEAVIDITDLIL